MKRLFAKIEGIVQGVGFRPFVYNIARSLNITGWISNSSEGVYIDAQGKEWALDWFLYKLKHNPPPLAKIENIIIEEKEIADFEGFTIKESEKKEEHITLVSPDIATCPKCAEEISDSLNKRQSYAFTNCTNCGPRFSVIKSIPYDRVNTTMEKFQLCSECLEEYKEPSNRRFHAETNACEKCGPHIWVEDNQGKIVTIEDAIAFTIKKLREGKIFAVKGLGGFQLVCDGTNEKAIEVLRKRKNRPHKPLAVMVKDIETVKKYCLVNSEEEKILTGDRKPIVILEQSSHYYLTENIAPNQNTLGVMLPYTPLHQLLFSNQLEVLIMTSANVSGLPMEYRNDNARENLKGIADYFLFHNRDIHISVDDSVVKVVKGQGRIIRRARGYTPEPIKMNCQDGIIACGSNMKNTFCITKGNYLFLSQHNGDLENLETYEQYKNNIQHFKNIFNFTPKYIACDMHPAYLSREYGDSLDFPKVYVQHHHAHIVSCLAENRVTNKVIGIAYDGTGYGTDGKVWGGEFLICDNKEFKRTGHLEYVKMPGGEKAIEEPWRMAVSHLYHAYNGEISNSSLSKLELGDSVENILAVLNSNINCPETSSIGRLFDAVACLIGIRDVISYEGQASGELEAKILKGCEEEYPYKIIKDGVTVIEVKETIKAIVLDRLNEVSKSKMAAKFHNTVVSFTTAMCSHIREQFNINEVALSGGVFQNSYLLTRLIKELKKINFIVYTNKVVPCNDGGVSLGQVVIANELIKDLQ